MPILSRTSTTLAAAIALALPILLASSSAIGQEQRPAIERFDLSFPGGTVEGYVDAIRSAAPGADIVIADERVLGLRIAPARLTAVDTHAAMMLLDMAPAIGEFDIFVRPIPHGDGDDAVYVVSAHSNDTTEVTTRVWSVAKPLAMSLSAESVLSAVEAALEVNGADATVRFHPDTALLIVKAPNRALNVVEQALDQMTASASDLRSTRRNVDEEIDHLEYRLAEVEGNARIAAEEMRLAAQELNWLDEAVPNPESRDDIRQRALVEMEVIRAQTKMDLMQREVQLVHSQIQRLKSQSDE